MLISKEYRAEQRELHKNRRYGAASKKFAPFVAELIAIREPRTILDYGAGKCALRAALGDVVKGRTFVEYDPARRGISKLPDGVFDLVCCIDVLEHIEPKCLEDVLRAIRKKTERLAFLTIHTGPAGKTLSDGRNAHLIQQPMRWWRKALDRHFPKVETRAENETTFFAFCEVA